MPILFSISYLIPPHPRQKLSIGSPYVPLVPSPPGEFEYEKER